MPLRLRLKPDEKIVINGAVLSVGGSHAQTLVLHNKAAVLRGRDILLPEDVDTPIKRIYFAVQLLYLDPDDHARYAEEFLQRMEDVLNVTTSAGLRATLDSAGEAVGRGDYYGAMVKLREALDYEAQILGVKTAD